MIENSEAWFVRSGSGWTTSIRPRGPRGWLLSLAYAVAVALLANAASHAAGNWLPWVALLLALTMVYFVTMWRLSVFVPRKGGSK